MSRDLRRAAGFAALSLLAFALPAAAVEAAIPRVSLEAGLGAAAAPAAAIGTSFPALGGSFAAPSLSAFAAPSLPLSAASLAAAPAFAAPAPAPALAPAPAAAASIPAAPSAIALAPAAARAVPASAAAAQGPDRAALDARAFDGSASFAELFESDPRYQPAVDVLESERPRFTPLQDRRVRETDRALTAAAREAASAALGGETAAAVSRGSTARRTYASPTPDYDISVVLPASWSGERFREFVAARSGGFKAALEASAGRAAARLFPGRPVTVTVDGPIVLTDAATRRLSAGTALFHVNLYAGDTGEYVKSDVTLTNSASYANPYPEYFDAQMKQVAALGGEEGAERALDDIRLAKRFFKNAIGAYKFYQGGPTAVGIEQMILQSGRVSDADRGRTVLEAGSFDKMMDRLYAAAYDGNGALRRFEDFQAAWTVHNAFMKPANFLSLLGPSWKRVAAAAKAYREARSAGRPITLDALGAKALRAAELRGPAGPAQRIVVRLVSRGRSAKTIDKVFQALKRRVDRETVLTRARDGKNGLTITVDVPARFDVEKKAKWIENFLGGWSSAAELVSISYPGSEAASAAPAPSAAPAAAPAAEPAGAEAPGALTLKLLERFAVRGPRPEERGDEYLYAQGAKTLPPGFEAAWAERVARPLPEGPGIETTRALLQRRSGGAYVMMPSFNEEGEEVLRPMKIPEALAQGVVSETLVELAYDEEGPRGLRPIGAYPQDMMIGRLARRGGELRLEGLFGEKGRTSSLYAPLRLSGGVPAREGAIVQAFVRPAAGGYEAVPMLDLGRAVTPEIAAREIALRRGARGYFDEAVVRQAEAAGRAEDPAGDYARIKASLARSGAGGRVEDLRALPFVTIDPPGAGDLDDAYHIEKHADGSYTWLLATADVANYVHPGTPAFRAAARIGNTFYSIDKDGVGEYPMNHPVVSKHLASLLDGKDSLAMITRMRFDADGRFRLDQSEVFLGLVRVQGRYTYDQAAALWRGEAGHGVRHVEQVRTARELSDKLAALDGARGKMNLSLDQTESVKREGVWSKRPLVEDPLLSESHHLIEELKVYGNRVIAGRLTGISRDRGVPHISRVHPQQSEAVTKRLQGNLREIGAPWNEGTLSEYLEKLQSRRDLSPQTKQVAQWLVLTSRQTARYAADDADGHEGLSLEAGAYDHPSAPIRRFSDMYNRALLEASLEGADPKDVHAAVLADLKAMGFESLEDYLRHLNGREQATRQMDYEVDSFMSLVELGKPENAGRTFRGYVRLARGGMNPSATIALAGSAATVVVDGPDALKYKLLERVNVTVRGVDLAARRLDAAVVKAP